MLRDASSETHLEARVQDLSEQATTDPLTGASNRAEFDRTHATLVEKSLSQRATFSIILCDIDRFKQVNDRFGHQAGDEVLVQFARLLQRLLARGTSLPATVAKSSSCSAPNATMRRRLDEQRNSAANGRECHRRHWIRRWSRPALESPNCKAVILRKQCSVEWIGRSTKPRTEDGTRLYSWAPAFRRRSRKNVKVGGPGGADVHRGP